MGRLTDVMIVEGTPSKMAEALEIAKARLGKRYINHPEYVRADNPAHTYPGSYYMAEVAKKAMAEGRIVL